MAKTDLSTGCFHVFWYVFLIIIVVYAAVKTGTFAHPLGIPVVFLMVAGLVIFLIFRLIKWFKHWITGADD